MSVIINVNEEAAEIRTTRKVMLARTLELSDKLGDLKQCDRCICSSCKYAGTIDCRSVLTGYMCQHCMLQRSMGIDKSRKTCDHYKEG